MYYLSWSRSVPSCCLCLAPGNERSSQGNREITIGLVSTLNRKFLSHQRNAFDLKWWCNKKINSPLPLDENDAFWFVSKWGSDWYIDSNRSLTSFLNRGTAYSSTERILTVLGSYDWQRKQNNTLNELLTRVCVTVRWQSSTLSSTCFLLYHTTQPWILSHILVSKGHAINSSPSTFSACLP